MSSHWRCPQLHRDVCLMMSNLNIMDQYVLCLQGTATKILNLTLGSRNFPFAAVAAGAMRGSLGSSGFRLYGSYGFLANFVGPGWLSMNFFRVVSRRTILV